MNPMVAKLKKSNSVRLNKLYEQYTGRKNGVQELGREIVISIILDKMQVNNHVRFSSAEIIRTIYNQIYNNPKNLTPNQVRIVRIMKAEGMTYKYCKEWLENILDRKFQINYVRNVVIGKLYKDVM